MALDRGVEPGRTYYYRLVASTRSGERLTFGPLSGTAGVQVAAFSLSPVSPTPTQGIAHIEFTVAREAPVRLSVLDVQGREVAVLVEGIRGPGRYEATWDGRTARDRAPAGLYFVRLQVPGRSYTRRLVWVR